MILFTLERIMNIIYFQDLDQKRSEIAELGRTKEKLSSRVEELETQIADLQEQVTFL
jgi:cell division protein FtsB